MMEENRRSTVRRSAGSRAETSHLPMAVGPAAGRPNGMFSAAVSSRMPTEPSGWSERTTTVRRTVIVDAHDLEEKQMLNWLLRARRGREDGRAARRGAETVGEGGGCRRGRGPL